MVEQKYIIVLDYSVDDEKEIPIVFPKDLVHRDVAWRYTAISAGFWYADKQGKVFVRGKSDSIGVSSRPEDAAIIQKYFYS